MRLIDSTYKRIRSIDYNFVKNVIYNYKDIILIVIVCPILYRLMPSLSCDVSIVQNIGIALLALLIPVVIFIFSWENEYMFVWDKNVIVNKVIEAKSLLVANIYIFAPLLIWKVRNGTFTSIFSGLFIVGVLIQLKILFNSYRWINTVEIQDGHDPSNYRAQLRRQYLKECDDKDGEKIWSITWQRKNINTFMERELLQIYMPIINSLQKKKENVQLISYLHIFANNLKNRNINDWTVFEVYFANLLELYYNNYLELQKRVSATTETTAPDSRSLEITIAITDLIAGCTEIAVKSTVAYIFFDLLKKHVNGKPEVYLNYLIFRAISCAFLENVTQSSQASNIWDEWFPKEWKITKENLTHKDTTIKYIANMWLQMYFNWALDKIFINKENIDRKLDNVTSNIFPSVDPILWANIILLVFCPFDNVDDKIQYVLANSPSFGFMGRLIPFNGSFDDKAAVETAHKYEQDTFELAILIFKSRLSKDNFTNVKDALEAKIYTEEKDKYRQHKYIKILQGLLAKM